MDVYMPICDGFNSVELICTFLKEMGEQGYTIEKQPYICFLTAHFLTVKNKSIANEVIDCILQKPIFKHGIQMLLTKANMFSDEHFEEL